jgi:D-3-phosphoglycerate dehydrogenase
VQIKGIGIDAETSAHMLYVTNDDKPGFIGRLGTTLGEAGINIATFHLGRSAPGKEAICLVSVDSAISPEMLAKIKGIPGVQRAYALRF